MIPPMKFATLLLLASTLSHATAGDLKLWYRTPGANGNYGDALMIGNGRMGGMLGGQVAAEKIYLNDLTLWTGTTNVPGKFDPENPAGFGAYQYFGTLNLALPGPAAFENYRRELDLND